jgi:hypothetical protein
VALGRLGWWRDWQAAIEARLGDGDEAARLAATLALDVIARALAPRDAPSVMTDPALHRVFSPAPDVRLDLEATDRRLLARSMAEAPATATLCTTHRGYAARARACSAALLTDLAGRIPGLDGSTARYVRRQVLSPYATISPDGTEARLGRPPLDVLLILSGLKRACVVLPHGRTLTLSGLVDA